MNSALQNILPQHALSRFAGFMANSKIPWLKNQLIHYFVTRYPVNMNEAIEPDPYHYQSFNDFFTRALKQELRPIDPNPKSIVSPADGTLSTFGDITHGSLLQAKGHYYTVQELLGGNKDRSEMFEQGSYMTIYLAPHNYHRIHMPFDGHLTEMSYIPGRLFSVNKETAESTHKLFARNERVVAIFNTSVGKMVIVLIGAMIVGSIETIWSSEITPIKKHSIKNYQYENPIFLKKGEEMGRFKLGSTVIILFEKNAIQWESDKNINSLLQFGQKIGEKS